MSAGSDGSATDAPLDAPFDAAVVRRLVRERRPDAPIVLMLDVDGTLAPIVARPEDAAVPDETRRLLAALAARPDVQVAIVSGRAPADAARVVGLDGLWVVGNHGAEVVAPSGEATVDPLVAPYRDAVAAAARELADPVAAVAGATLEDKRLSLTIHWRRVADPAGIATLERLAAAAAARHALALHSGKAVFELRPPVRVNKGTAVLALARRLGAGASGAGALFAGDDVTDEDAFRALRAELPRAVTILVAPDEERARGGDGGPAPPLTAAEFAVPGVAALRDLLRNLVIRLASPR
ncbi:MAG: trehalose-phosphatase [Gemmatimonadaceae bacterium]